MSLPALLLEGSVKNIRGTKGVTPYIFEYSDRYSVFDWGAMPNQLEGKGKSLAFMAWMFFDLMGDAKRWESWKLSPELEKIVGSAELPRTIVIKKVWEYNSY